MAACRGALRRRPPATATPKDHLVTGADLLTSPQSSVHWHLPRPPLPFETSLLGVFAVATSDIAV
jgi:hypothetical protein